MAAGKDGRLPRTTLVCGNNSCFRCICTGKADYCRLAELASCLFQFNQLYIQIYIPTKKIYKLFEKYYPRLHLRF